MAASRIELANFPWWDETEARKKHRARQGDGSAGAAKAQEVSAMMASWGEEEKSKPSFMKSVMFVFYSLLVFGGAAMVVSEIQKRGALDQVASLGSMVGDARNSLPDISLSLDSEQILGFAAGGIFSIITAYFFLYALKNIVVACRS